VLYDGRFAGFRSHPKLEGTHALFSPSSPAWLRYTPEKVIERLNTARASALGTELHETAARNIRRGIRLMDHPEYPTLAPYVNHAIDYGMVPEQTLFYTLNFFGTADTISYDVYDDDDRFDGYLRIHDLKTGVSKVHMDQLYAYAAIFCLEYEIKPFRVDGELRIYQGSDILYEPIDRGVLASAYSTIKAWDQLIEQHRSGGLI
jgi:hypothetical protein